MRKHLAMSALLDLLFPSKCVVCERPPQLVCVGCLPAPRPQSELLSGYRLSYALDLEGAAEKLITGYKDQSKLALARCLAGYLDEALELLPVRPAKILVPPSSRKNFARRGYNPVELICSKSPKLRPVKRVRARSIKFTLDQRGLSARDRRENLEGAFEVESGSGPLLIVDDVVTTGATALSLASASAAAGFEVVGICVVARRNSPGQTRETKKA